MPAPQIAGSLLARAVSSKFASKIPLATNRLRTSLPNLSRTPSTASSILSVLGAEGNSRTYFQPINPTQTPRPIVQESLPHESNNGATLGNNTPKFPNVSNLRNFLSGGPRAGGDPTFGDNIADIGSSYNNFSSFNPVMNPMMGMMGGMGGMGMGGSIQYMDEQANNIHLNFNKQSLQQALNDIFSGNPEHANPARVAEAVRVLNPVAGHILNQIVSGQVLDGSGGRTWNQLQPHEQQAIKDNLFVAQSPNEISAIKNSFTQLKSMEDSTQAAIANQLVGPLLNQANAAERHAKRADDLITAGI